MSRLILIETSTSLCSAAISENGKVRAYVESTEPRAHASLAVPFVKRLLDSEGLTLGDCDAVCVSSGPGSYTGLRVGVSSAKGLCYGSGLPLVGVGTLETLVAQAIGGGHLPEGCTAIIPMVDARRMEVYTAVFSPEGRRLGETKPLIVEEGCFRELLEAGPVLFIGDGAAKCEAVLGCPNAHFVQCCPRADAMTRPAEEKFAAGLFEDVAYFEPFYLKVFVATVSKKRLF